MRWTIAPEIDRLAPSDLAAVDAAWETLPSEFRAAELGLPSLTGRFLLSARESRGLVAALQTAAPLALIVLGVLAALAIWELAGLLALRAISRDRPAGGAGSDRTHAGHGDCG